MAFEKYDNAQLSKMVKSLRTINIVFAIIWLGVIAFFIGTQIYASNKGGLSIITAVPFIAGPITILPIYMTYKNAKKELSQRKLNQ